MCDFIVTPILTAIGGGTAAAGATAGAITIGQTLQTIGAVAGLAGTVAQGIQTRNAYEDQVAAIGRQKVQEQQIAATNEQRSRDRFTSQIAQQRADLVARGVSLDSPTAVFLGQTAAREMVFEAQSIRSDGFATQEELTTQQRALNARGRQAVVRGGFSAAGSFLNSAPDIWPELLA